MMTQTLETIEAEIDHLPLSEQLWLIERLVNRIRARAGSAPTASEADLAAMASDPAIQQELRQIDAEFAGTETDGLDRV
jgi:hypothetical protein